MKRFLMAVGLMFVLALGVFAQAGKTNYYRYVETVNTRTGVRSKSRKDHGKYITFTRNSCYISDEKGVQTIDFIYTYEGERNNLYVYRYIFKIGNVDFMTRSFTFSKDYKRLNEASTSPGGAEVGTNDEILIYELADSPSKGPDAFY